MPVVARILTEMEEVSAAFPDYEPYKSQKDALLRDGQRRPGLGKPVASSVH